LFADTFILRTGWKTVGDPDGLTLLPGMELFDAEKNIRIRLIRRDVHEDPSRSIAEVQVCLAGDECPTLPTAPSIRYASEKIAVVGKKFSFSPLERKGAGKYRCSIKPAPPEGVKFKKKKCRLKGTPQRSAKRRPYTVRIINSVGESKSYFRFGIRKSLKK
jgi:hypothetical protein